MTLKQHPFVILLIVIIFIQTSFTQNANQSTYVDLTNTRTKECSNIKFFDISDLEREQVWSQIYSKSSLELQENIEFLVNNSYEISNNFYFSQLSSFTIPWLIIAIGTFFLSIMYILIVFKSNSVVIWIKNHTEEEFLENTKRYHKYGIISIVILNFTIITCSIIALVFINDINEGLSYSSCYLSQSFDDLLNKNDENFVGYNNLQVDLEILSKHVQEFQINLKALFQDRKSITMTKKLSELIEFNDQLKRNLPRSPLPIMISSNGTNVIEETESYFSKSKLFDYILSNEKDEDYLTFQEYYDLIQQKQELIQLTDQVNQVISFYDKIFLHFGSIENASFALRDQRLTSIYMRAEQQLSIINNYLFVYSDKYLSFHQSLNESMKKYTSSIIGIGITLIILCFIQILVWGGYWFNNRFKIKAIVDFLWFICNLLLIALLVVNIFLHSHSELSNDICIYFDGFVNKIEVYKSQNIIDFDNTKQTLKNCLFEDGNIYEQLNLVQKLKDIRTYMNSEKGVEDQIQRINSNYEQFIQKLSKNTQSLTYILDGTIVDLDEKQQMEFNKIVKSFNDLKQNNNCAELAFQSCSDGTSPKKQGSQNQTQFCWHPSYLITRYSASCPEQQNEFQKLKQHFQSQAQGWIEAQQLESQFISLNQQLSMDLNQYINQIQKFNEKEQMILSSMNNILKSTNCTFIKGHYNKMLDGMCIIYSESVQKESILVIIIICMLFLSVLANCLTSIKVTHMESYEEYASTKVINFGGSSRMRGPNDPNQMQHVYPLHVMSGVEQELK
ncbi:unnamed protein product [Paramecium pentaurelia]|uniref:Transmembrane protein n=1 Tax=Paramecium pentaurelia TaxID=43138 RepID=A0A8S1VKA0_9CILI|nr:unnamed protein product [Paramecium pentaurelia]